MKRLITVSLIGALALLSACGGDKPPVNPPVTPPVTPPPNTALVTPIGANIGDPVTQTIGAAGGVVTLGKVTVSAPSGAFNGASLRLQAISDTYNDTGQGIAISSDATWNKYLTVTFPIDPSDDSPESLGLAVQQSDGSWRSLEPVKVDVAAGTVSVGLPAVTEVSAARVRPQGLLDLTRVIKFKRFYLKPASATLEVKGSKTFVPYAQVLEGPKNPCTRPPSDPNEYLVPLPPKCWLNVTREYPFTNDKDGFVRFWSVNGIRGGNATLGTISPSSGSGATYTAPDKKPSPDTVTVSFTSLNNDTLSVADPEAKVKITDGFLSSYTGSVGFSGSISEVTYTGQGNLNWKIVENLPNDLAKYETTDSVQVTANYPDCAPVSAGVPVTGTMIVFDPVRGGPGDPYPTKYWFGLSPAERIIVTGQCGQPPRPTQLIVWPFGVTTVCPENPTLPDAPKYTDLAKLAGSGSWKCSLTGFDNTVNWDFAGK